MDDTQLPTWYQSSQGPELSLTLKMIAGLLLPTIQDLFHIQIGSDTVNNVIQALLIIGFGLAAAWGYLRAKKAHVAEVAKLQGIVQTLSRGQGQPTQERPSGM